MKSALTILAGLIVGALVAVGIIAAIVLAGSGPIVIHPSAAPTVAPSAAPSVVPSAIPSAAPSASGSTAPSTAPASAGPSARPASPSGSGDPASAVQIRDPGANGTS